MNDKVIWGFQGSLREAALMTSAGEDGGTSGHKKIESWAELPVVHYPSQQQSPC